MNLTFHNTKCLSVNNSLHSLTAFFPFLVIFVPSLPPSAPPDFLQKKWVIGSFRLHNCEPILERFLFWGEKVKKQIPHNRGPGHSATCVGGRLASTSRDKHTERRKKLLFGLFAAVLYFSEKNVSYFYVS